jgi:hypothetical protein
MHGQADMQADLEGLQKELRNAQNKDILTVPEIEKYQIPQEEMRSWFQTEEDQKIVSALYTLEGKPSRVRRDGPAGYAVLNYEDLYPADLGPLVVLDASGDKKTIYRFWAEGRKGLRFLPSPPKSYAPLTIHHWDKGSGKGQFKRDSRNNKNYLGIVDRIVEQVCLIARTEKILIVHFKPGKHIRDIQKDIRDRLPGFENLCFVTWGKHTATNDFHECKHVIIACVLRYSNPEGEALGRGAKKLRTEDELSNGETQYGEIAHHIFQAACRGYVRKANGDQCPDGCNLYVIFPTKGEHGLPKEILTRCFPEATVKPWGMEDKPKTKQDELIHILKVPGTYRKAWIQAQLGISPQRLSTLLRDRNLYTRLKDEGMEVDNGRQVITTVRAGNRAKGDVWTEQVNGYC